jgi:hypothetical protein
MMKRRCPDHARAASPRAAAQLGLTDLIDRPRRADGSRDGAAGITLKPYPPCAGLMNPDNEQAAGSLRSSLAYGNTMRDQD